MTPAMTEDATGRYDLGPIERIPPGEGQTFRVGGREIAVFRTRDDAVHATQARCPHRAGLLADGLMGDGKIICPLHSFKFELATGTSLGGACQSLRTFRAEVTPDRRVIVMIAPDTGADWSDEP
jgi:nitrite reductase [NAD(P)H] small subunit